MSLAAESLEEDFYVAGALPSERYRGIRRYVSPERAAETGAVSLRLLEVVGPIPDEDNRRLFAEGLHHGLEDIDPNSQYYHQSPNQ